MYEPLTCVAALPSDAVVLRVVHTYGFGAALPVGLWVFGAQGLRHTLRILQLSQPRRLSGESHPPASEEQLTRDWNDFLTLSEAERARLTKPWLRVDSRADISRVLQSQPRT